MISVSSAGDARASAFPDMTALLDVIFILLVFLLLTANTAPEALEVALPEDSEAQAQSVVVDQQITVTLFAEVDRWGIGSKEYNDWFIFEGALREKVASIKDPEIILSGDRQVSLEKTLKLFAWLKKNNLSAAQILMSPAQS